MGVLLEGLLNGISVGAIYVLLALGFTFIYASTRAVNFGHGDWAMLAGMTAATLSTGFAGFLGAGLLAAVTGALLGLAVYYLLLVRARSRDLITMALILLGTALIIQGAALRLWGTDPRGIQLLSGMKAFHIGGGIITPLSLLIIAVTTVLVLCVTAILRFSTYGRSMQACAHNPESAALSGINVRWVVAWALALSGVLAGTAGFFATAVTGMNYQSGFPLTMEAFAAAALGSLRSATGAVIGGLILGVAQGVSARYFGGANGTLISFIAAFLILTVGGSQLRGGVSFGGRGETAATDVEAEHANL